MNIPANGLVVPIRVEALLIAKADQNDDHFALPDANFSRLPPKGVKTGNVYISQRALNQPFDGHVLQEGIYLHWQLPRALRRVGTGADGSTQLPDAPDRWLVVRSIVDNATGQATTRSWVVESNYVSVTADYSTTTIPWTPDQESNNTWRYLGRVYDYAEWVTSGNKGKYYTPFNSMGYGALDFSSFYPNCANVFGMRDDTLNDSFNAATHRLSYTVIGWYSNSASDPLAGQTIKGDANSFGWIFDDEDGTLTPGYTLLEGSVRAIDWNPDLPNGYFPDANDPAAVKVSIGNTAPEALSALVAWLVRLEGPKNVERLMNAVQISMLQELGQPGGLARFEESLFNAEFSGLQGGTLWEIQPAQGQTAAPLDGAIADQLQQLNEKQQTHNEQQQQYVSLSRQIFADWTKFMIIQHMPKPTGQLPAYPDINAVYSFLNDEIVALNDLSDHLDDLTDAINALAGVIVAALPDTMELVQLAAPRYYKPNDPVLLLSGEDIPNLPPDFSDTIISVLTTKLITAISFPAGLVPGSVACLFEAAWLSSFGDTAALPYPTIDTAWRASLLVNGDMPPLLTALLAEKGGPGNPASINSADTESDIQAAQLQWLARTPPENGISFNGPTPQGDILFKAWSIPWNPIAIWWAFDFYPLVSVNRNTGSGYPGNTVIAKLIFDKQSFNYEYPEGTSFAALAQQYKGDALLSSGATVDLRSQIEQYLRYNDDPELQQILQDIQNMPALAQALSGFHDALAMLVLAMQLPVADPSAINRTYSDFSNNLVAQAVGSQNQHTPDTDFIYNPLRAGKAVLRRLAITDAFGRWKAVNVDNLIVSETIPFRSTGPAQPPDLLLPTRLAQAMQLDFRWLSASDYQRQMSSHDGDNPVCGWVVPNHLDGSLMFYDGNGVAIGSIFSSGDGNTLFWLDAPGGAWAGTDIEQAFATSNAVLRAFALATWTNGAAYVQNLIRTFDRAKTYVVPNAFQQDPSTSVLVGTPMALVQTSLQLSLMGYPEPDQSYKSLEADMVNTNPVDRSVFGFTDILFPVLLGSLSELNDGLYGFFLPSGEGVGQYDFRNFFSEAAAPGLAHISAPQAGTLTLTSGMTKPVNIAMLIDPLCEVHAYTGILPVKTIAIPATVYASAVSKLLFSFLTAPVIWTSDGVALPLPAEGDGAWSWTEINKEGWQNQKVNTLNQKATLQNAAAADEGWLVLGKNNNS